MKIKEIWKPVQITQNNIYYDFSDRYMVSSFGRIKNINTNKILKPLIETHNYYYINLRFNNNRKVYRFRIHRLVANAFIPNPNNYLEVNHIDGNKLNNNVNNLEWCTRKYNINHAYNLELINHRKLKEYGKLGTEIIKRKVNKYDLNGKFIKTYESFIAAKKDVGLKYDTSIRRCCKGELKSAAGYKWKYTVE